MMAGIVITEFRGPCQAEDDILPRRFQLGGPLAHRFLQFLGMAGELCLVDARRNEVFYAWDQFIGVHRLVDEIRGSEF